MDCRFRIKEIPFESFEWIVQSCGARLMGDQPHQLPRAVTTDSRLVETNDLFVPIQGEHADGHAFIEQAFKQGAGASLVADESKAARQQVNHCYLTVEDTLFAFGELARHWKNRFKLKTVAVTGSNGKTTTKNMITSILSQSHHPHSTAGNWNNLVGLPFTCLGVRNEHTHLVAEMGMNAFGEIERLTEIVAPDVGVIVNVMPVHLEGVGDLDGVVKAKTEMWRKMQGHGTIVVNADFPQLVECSKGLSSKVLTFSRQSKNADIYLDQIELLPEKSSAKLYVDGQSIAINVALPGEHNLDNAVAAAAATHALGVSLKDIQKGIENSAAEQLRSNVKHLEQGITFYIDCYNANPGSMRAALNAAMRGEGQRHIAVLGDMGELGSAAHQAHVDILRLAEEIGFNKVICFGEAFKAAASETGSPNIAAFTDEKQVMDELASMATAGDYILFKGSRYTRMERFVQFLEQTLIGEKS